MSKKQEQIDLNKNPRSVENFLSKFIDKNGASVNEYGQQICKQLNIDPNDLFDKTLEQAMGQIENAKRPGGKQETLRQEIKLSLANARVEAHKRKRLYRAQQIQRFLLGISLQNSAQYQLTQERNNNDLEGYQQRNKYNVVSDLFSTTKLAQMPNIQMYPKCKFRASSGSVTQTQITDKQRKDALINKSMRNADDLLKVAPRLRSDSADDLAQTMKVTRSRAKSGFKKKGSMQHEAHRTFQGSASPQRAGNATFLTATNEPEPERDYGNIQRPQTQQQLYSTGNLRKAKITKFQQDGNRQLNREKQALSYQKNIDRFKKEKQDMDKLLEYNIGEKNKKREDVYREATDKVNAIDAVASKSFSQSNKAMHTYMKSVNDSPVMKLKHKKGDQSHYDPNLMGVVDDYYVHECGHKKQANDLRIQKRLDKQAELKDQFRQRWRKSNVVKDRKASYDQMETEDAIALEMSVASKTQAGFNRHTMSLNRFTDYHKGKNEGKHDKVKDFIANRDIQLDQKLFKIAIERDLDITKKRKTKDEALGFQIAEKQMKIQERVNNQTVKYETEQKSFMNRVKNQMDKDNIMAERKLGSLSRTQDAFKKLMHDTSTYQREDFLNTAEKIKEKRQRKAFMVSIRQQNLLQIQEQKTAIRNYQADASRMAMVSEQINTMDLKKQLHIVNGLNTNKRNTFFQGQPVQIKNRVGQKITLQLGSNAAGSPQRVEAPKKTLATEKKE